MSLVRESKGRRRRAKILIGCILKFKLLIGKVLRT